MTARHSRCHPQLSPHPGSSFLCTLHNFHPIFSTPPIPTQLSIFNRTFTFARHFPFLRSFCPPPPHSSISSFPALLPSTNNIPDHASWAQRSTIRWPSSSPLKQHTKEKPPAFRLGNVTHFFPKIFFRLPHFAAPCEFLIPNTQPTSRSKKMQYDIFDKNHLCRMS